ncbi:alpha/beta fold hydrolase [Hymenobacter puniceus]|uniref:alpha/beta fold hydrolase n=1 Tax=Hymenobacter sp. BT190 TaxID=2763505 RepID=UPI00165112ED|nr:alpha/beta fold hydrolase [Hymenobacter sp. BT190]MBC6698505.1 alpha/beta fold hydrolase [Hymenobacter sp. BT190]
MQAVTKHPVLLLHGALACEKQLRPLARELAAHYTVRTFSFGGHGGQPLEEAAFTMRHFAAQVTQFLDSLGWESAHVFGYSMGGYAALAAAVAAPARFRSITTLGTKLDWSPATAALETRFLDAEKMRAKIPQFAAQLELQHAPTPLPALLAATASLMRGLGDVPLLTAQNLSGLEVPVQVLVGELDKTAGVDASRHFADFMPRATFEILFNTPHPLDKVNPDLLLNRIVRFVEQMEDQRH